MVLYQLLVQFYVLWPLLSMAAPAMDPKDRAPKRASHQRKSQLWLCRTDFDHGSPQLSCSAVQASIVSERAVVCLQALPGCF